MGKSPERIAVNPETNVVYVPNRDLNSTAVIDGKTNKVVKTIRVGITSAEVAVNPVTNKVYVTIQDEHIVFVTDGPDDRLLANITVGLQPHDIAVNPVTDVTNTASNSISLIV